MKLVLTNDDGIDAPGLEALFQASAGLGERIVVAPKTQQSGVGHRMTTREPIQLAEEGPGRFSLGGTPADCSRVALTQIGRDTDWLLAGINRGGNLGCDFFPSGTIAAAREAALLGYRAMAVSQYVASDREVNWEATARRAAMAIRYLLEHSTEDRCYWSINLPHPQDDLADCEIVFCPLDPSPMDVRFRVDGSYVHYEGVYDDRPRRAGHDVDVCFSGHIAVTRLPVDIGEE